MGTYLQLPPQMGGTRFGPFPAGIIYIGSDPARCQIVLNAAQGVFAVHCIISDMGNGTYTIGPTQQNLKLFLVKKGEQKAWPVQAAVQANPGDWIVVGSEAGPRFEIQNVGDSPAASRRAGMGMGGMSGGGGGGFGGRIANEMSRRAQAKLLAKNPYFRTFYNLQARFKHGGWKSPYFIVGVLGALVGIVGAGGAGCSGIFYAVYQQLF